MGRGLGSAMVLKHTSHAAREGKEQISIVNMRRRAEYTYAMESWQDSGRLSRTTRSWTKSKARVTGGGATYFASHLDQCSRSLEGNVRRERGIIGYGTPKERKDKRREV